MSTYLWANRCPIFSQIVATFWFASLRFTSLRFASLLPGRKRGRHIGGAPAPPSPPGGDRANNTLTHPADVLQNKIKSFYTDWRRQKMNIFPADVLPRKYVQKFSDRRRHLKHSQFFWLIWKNFMITRKILPTSFRKNLNKNSQIDVVMWSVRDFSGNM